MFSFIQKQGKTNKKFFTRVRQAVAKIEDQIDNMIITTFKESIALVKRKV